MHRKMPGWLLCILGKSSLPTSTFYSIISDFFVELVQPSAFEVQCIPLVVPWNTTSLFEASVRPFSSYFSFWVLPKEEDIKEYCLGPPDASGSAPPCSPTSSHTHQRMKARRNEEDRVSQHNTKLARACLGDRHVRMFHRQEQTANVIPIIWTRSKNSGTTGTQSCPKHPHNLLSSLKWERSCCHKFWCQEKAWHLNSFKLAVESVSSIEPRTECLWRYRGAPPGP